MDPIQATKIKYSVLIGFLTIALFTFLGLITSAAADGNPIARWILLVIFGAIAVILASYAIGYVILTIVGKEEEPEEAPKPKKKVVAKRENAAKKKVAKKKRTIKKKNPSKRRKRKGRK